MVLTLWFTYTHWMFALTLRGLSLLWTEWRARCGYTHTHWMSALTSRGPSLLWTRRRARCGYTHMHWMSALTSRGPVVALDRIKSWMSIGRWADRFILMAMMRHERSRCQQAGSRSLTLRWVELLDHWLWCSVCPSLILCRLAGSDPMQLGTAMLHVDWLDSRTLGDWHLG
jgi:hypothetical protein